MPCQMCGLDGHLASRCHRRFKRDFLGIGNNGKVNKRQAVMATQGSTPSYFVDPTWYMDTDATDHLTQELDKLSTREPYHGHGKVHTVNGTCMHISHIGHASLLTHTSKKLHLLNVLRVPSITRNLLSVKKITLDNNVFVEFHHFHFFCQGLGHEGRSS